MKRISSGYFSAAYYTTDRENVILFTIDPLKTAMYNFVQTYSCSYFPVIEKIAENDEYQDTITVFRMEKLVPIGKFIERGISQKRKKVISQYENLDNALWKAGIVNGHFSAYRMGTNERFERWMDIVMNDCELFKFEEPLREQFDFYYNMFGDDLAFDFHCGNLSVRPRQNELVFSDIYALRYLCDIDYYRIARNYPDRLLRKIYTE